MSIAYKPWSLGAIQVNPKDERLRDIIKTLADDLTTDLCTLYNNIIEQFGCKFNKENPYHIIIAKIIEDKLEETPKEFKDAEGMGINYLTVVRTNLNNRVSIYLSESSIKHTELNGQEIQKQDIFKKILEFINADPSEILDVKILKNFFKLREVFVIACGIIEKMQVLLNKKSVGNFEFKDFLRSYITEVLEQDFKNIFLLFKMCDTFLAGLDSQHPHVEIIQKVLQACKDILQGCYAEVKAIESLLPKANVQDCKLVSSSEPLPILRPTGGRPTTASQAQASASAGLVLVSSANTISTIVNALEF